MCERVVLYERCLALQLVRTHPPPCPPTQAPPPVQASPISTTSSTLRKGGSQFTLGRNHVADGRKLSGGRLSAVFGSGGSSSSRPSSQCSEASPNSGSSTPTPTNGIAPDIPVSPSKDASLANKYQNGYLLFQAWQEANCACVWDGSLVEAVQASVYVGALVGGVLLLTGTPRVLATVLQAWVRTLLRPPIGFAILMLGEVEECSVMPVAQGQFTPLPDALCWVIHDLTSRGRTADLETVRSGLIQAFPSLTEPSHDLVYHTLGGLIRERKVCHTGRGYFIVQADTYHSVQTLPPDVPPRPLLLTPREALTRAHGATETMVEGKVTHQAVQTNLADVICGGNASDTVIYARPPNAQSSVPHPRPLDRRASLRLLSRRQALNVARGGSLRLSPTKVAQLEAEFSYNAFDTSDISTKEEKSSVLSKLLRLAPRRKIATFTAQFPPPEWNDPEATVKHLHSVATQTRSRHQKNESEGSWSPMPGVLAGQPHSSTLPRRPLRRAESTPPRDRMLHVRHLSRGPSPALTSSSSPSPHSTPRHHPRSSSHPQRPATASGLDSSMDIIQTLEMNGRPPRPPKDIPLRHHSVDLTPHIRAASESPARYRQYHYQNETLQQQQKHQSQQLHQQHKSESRKSMSSLKVNGIPPGIGVKGGESAGKRSTENAGHTRKSSKSPPPPEWTKVFNSPRKDPRRHDGGQPKEIVAKTETKGDDPRIQPSEDQERSRYNRASLQLDLKLVHNQDSSHMNNSRKIVSSPSRTEGLSFKNNMLAEAKRGSANDLTKGSSSDLASRNLGYRDIDKCDKQLCADRLDQLHNDKENEKDKEAPKEKDKLKDETIESAIPLQEKSGSNKVVIDKVGDSLHDTENAKPTITPTSGTTPGFLEEDTGSVRTYPSVSDLHITFKSLAAQKLLHGVSVNSIDTLVEVNMAAETSPKSNNPKCNVAVSRTDFGFL